MPFRSGWPTGPSTPSAARKVVFFFFFSFSSASVESFFFPARCYHKRFSVATLVITLPNVFFPITIFFSAEPFRGLSFSPVLGCGLVFRCGNFFLVDRFLFIGGPRAPFHKTEDPLSPGSFLSPTHGSNPFSCSTWF